VAQLKLSLRLTQAQPGLAAQAASAVRGQVLNLKAHLPVPVPVATRNIAQLQVEEAPLPKEPELLRGLRLHWRREMLRSG
jgi:hypothetical protein